MLQYLVILLDNSSTPYCHYDNVSKERCLISTENLKLGILFAMKENLMIQFVYPDYQLPQNYHDIINSIDHNDIASSQCKDEMLRSHAEVIVFNGWTDIMHSTFDEEKVYTLRTTKEDLFIEYKSLRSVLEISCRLNIVIVDIDKFSEVDFDKYETVLQYFGSVLKNSYANGKVPQLNLLTDRIMLKSMNNCNAGLENVTLAPNGKFYVCPAFFYDGECCGNEKSLSSVCARGYSIGSLSEGLDLKNPQLYKLDHAPLCRTCDAFQCKRCVWLNRKTTLEVNTPSHEQCVVAHLERNASRQLLADIRTLGSFLPNKEIKEIDYIDPFYKLKS